MPLNDARLPRKAVGLVTLPGMSDTPAPSFLASPQAAALVDSTPAEIGYIVTTFAGLCRKRLGKEPHALSASDVHGVLGHLLPEAFRRRDPRAEKVPAVLEAYIEFLIETHPSADGKGMRDGFHGTIGEFLQTARTGKNPHGHHQNHEPVVNEGPKVGRNDPCPCGSGAKYKRCHGKPGSSPA